MAIFFSFLKISPTWHYSAPGSSQYGTPYNVGYFKSFASLINSPLKINKWTSNQKKHYSPGYKLLCDIITISSEAFFISINEFVDAYGIPCQQGPFSQQPTTSMFVAHTYLSRLEYLYPSVHSWFDNILHGTHCAHSCINFTSGNTV